MQNKPAIKPWFVRASLEYNGGNLIGIGLGYWVTCFFLFDLASIWISSVATACILFGTFLLRERKARSFLRKEVIGGLLAGSGLGFGFCTYFLIPGHTPNNWVPYVMFSLIIIGSSWATAAQRKRFQETRSNP